MRSVKAALVQVLLSSFHEISHRDRTSLHWWATAMP